MRIIPVLALLTALSPTLSPADGGVAVPLPDIPEMTQEESKAFLFDLIVANVVSSNCDGYLVGLPEWALLNGTSDLVVKRLGMDVGTYDDEYQRAFDYLDQPGTCVKEGPNVQIMIDKLIGWGGSLTPIE